MTGTNAPSTAISDQSRTINIINGSRADQRPDARCRGSAKDRSIGAWRFSTDDFVR
jgi:hypothetical protein